MCRQASIVATQSLRRSIYAVVKPTVLADFHAGLAPSLLFAVTSQRFSAHATVAGGERTESAPVITAGAAAPS